VAGSELAKWPKWANLHQVVDERLRPSPTSTGAVGMAAAATQKIPQNGLRFKSTP
jgi:hypothetical protein